MTGGGGFTMPGWGRICALDQVPKKNHKAAIQFGGRGGLSVYPKQTIVMKLTQKLLVVGTVVTFASFSQAWAGGKEGSEPTPGVEEPAVAPDEEIVVDEEVLVDETVTGEEPEVVVCDRTVDGEPIDKCVVLEKGEVVDLDGEAPGGPEVQRGEDGEMNPDLIFYNTAVLDGGAEGESTSKVGPAFGSDERAADIESKGPRITAVKSQKKGPVALVKKGRVFLR